LYSIARDAETRIRGSSKVEEDRSQFNEADILNNFKKNEGVYMISFLEILSFKSFIKHQRVGNAKYDKKKSFKLFIYLDKNVKHH
jgi:hypothetical protein